MIIFIVFIGLLITYLFAIMPRLFERPDITPFKGFYYAHRGLHDNTSNAPENSLRAFEFAVKNGYGIELDVQLTKDFIPVVFHDYNLVRACGVDCKVKDLTYEELNQFYLFRSTERIPRLEEVLRIINGKVSVIIELKVKWNLKKTCQITDSILRHYKGTYCIESFSPFALIWYRKHHPEVMRGQLSSDFNKDKEPGNKFEYFVLKNLLMNFRAKPDFISYDYKHKDKLSFRICTRLFGAYAFAWTIRSKEALEQSRDSFDYFIFDSFEPKKE